MNKVISFTKLRFVALIISVLVIAGGIAGTLLLGSFNLGIDFKAGVNMRMQIAPVAFKVAYEGQGSARFDIGGSTITVEVTADEDTRYTYNIADYSSLAALTGAMKEIEGLRISDIAASSTEASRIIGLSFPYDLEPDTEYPVNMVAVADVPEVSIADVRLAVQNLGNPQIQVVGNESAQEYLIRVENPEGEEELSDALANDVRAALAASFGEDQVVEKQADFVGPRFSRNLAQQSIFLSLFALGLILLYIWFRFKLSYAVAAIVTLIHDVLIMAGFIGVSQMEVSTATVAAVLTIIGYSLNDTIVIFDRIRENTALMRDSDIKTVINTSITQSLGRTIITSVTTLLAVVAIFVFGAGTIKSFALAVIVGIVVGTYSSIFIASPIYLGWSQASVRRNRAKNLKKGAKAAAPGPQDEPQPVATDEPPSEGGEAAEVQKPQVVEIPKIERKLKGKRKKKR